MSQMVMKHPGLKTAGLGFDTAEVHAGEPRDQYGALIPRSTKHPPSTSILPTTR